jgi:ethanolamine permease
MSAEEVIDPPRAIPRGFLAGIATLVVLALATLVCTTGVLPWQTVAADDSPLPRALARVLSPGHPMTHLMIYLGLLGLVASFHGILLGCSRQVFALARAGLLPTRYAALHPRYRSPARAVGLTVLVGGLATLSGRTDALITLSVLGALGVYALSLAAVLRLRRDVPELPRPYRAPGHPWLPRAALGLTALAGAAVVSSAPGLGAGVCGGAGGGVGDGRAEGGGGVRGGQSSTSAAVFAVRVWSNQRSSVADSVQAAMRARSGSPRAMPHRARRHSSAARWLGRRVM